MAPVPVPDLVGRLVLVTGAASGIGRATAVAAAHRGARMVLLDIDRDGLDRTTAAIRDQGGTVVVAERLDLADHDAVRAFCDRLTNDHGAMDVVMNIAGISAWGTVTALPHDTWRRLVDVNLMGPIHIIEYLVPPMIAAGRGGHLVNVSSAAGIIALPWHAAYSASKFGLRGVSEVLRFDLAPARIGVSLVCPGAVDTGLTETISIAGVDHEDPRFRRLRSRFRKHAATPEQVAAAVLRGVERNRYWVYTSTDIRLAHLLQRWFPPGYVLVMRLIHRWANRALPQVGRAERVEP